jgi:transcription elongation GreA/GreB family factor
MNQKGKISGVLRSIDPARLDGTPGQKMYLAQEIAAAGERERALEYAYGVLTQARNDPEAALRYFGLIIMFDRSGCLIPRLREVALDAWVRLEGANGERNEFIIEQGESRPAEGILNPTHPTASAVIGLGIGESFNQESAFGDDTTWRVAEIKHKYLHALHDVIENFQTRFPDAQGLYRIAMKEGDVQPALDQVKKTSETNRKLADLYFLQHLPMALVASRLGGDAVGFADYVRSLGANIETCAGNEPERAAARKIIEHHRAAGAVLDTYTAWTVSTMDIYDVLVAVFGNLAVAQSTIDELRILKEKDEIPPGRSMMIAWHNGQFFSQEYSKEDIEARARYIEDQIGKIEGSCAVLAATAPDAPTELASVLTENFDPHALDVANLTIEGYVLVSEDLYFRQLADTAVSAKGVWLQAVLRYALEKEMISLERYADLVVKLAARRHNYITVDPRTLSNVLSADETPNLDQFRIVTEFIGNKTAELRSHIAVVISFLEGIWDEDRDVTLKEKRATSILLERMARHRVDGWSTVIAFLRRSAGFSLRGFVNNWVRGHLLSVERVDQSSAEIRRRSAKLQARTMPGLPPKSWLRFESFPLNE